MVLLTKHKKNVGEPDNFDCEHAFFCVKKYKMIIFAKTQDKSMREPQTSIKRKDQASYFRHLGVLLIVSLSNWCIWFLMGLDYFMSLGKDVLWKEVITDTIEVTIETVFLVELVSLSGRWILSRFWRVPKPRFPFLLGVFLQYFIVTACCLGIAFLDSKLYPDYPFIFWRTFVSDGLIVSIYIIFYYLFFLTREYQKESRRRNLLKLDMLSIQSDNHFLFNSLGTLAGLIGTDDERALQLLDSLTRIFRYLTSHSEEHITSLEKELAFTEEYVRILNMRYSGIHVTIDEKLRGFSCFVCPVSIQCLVENAVRHNKHGEKTKLEISIMLLPDEILVENPLNPISAPSTRSGLRNLQHRYQLVTDKKIRIIKAGEKFQVYLPILHQQDLTNEYFNH